MHHGTAPLTKRLGGSKGHWGPRRWLTAFWEMREQGGDMNAAGPGAVTVWGENRGEQREPMALPKKAETTKKIWKSNAMQHCACTCLSFHLNGHPRLTG